MISVLTILFWLLWVFVLCGMDCVFIYVVCCCCFSCDARCNIQGQKLQADHSAVAIPRLIAWPLLTTLITGQKNRYGVLSMFGYNNL